MRPQSPERFGPASIAARRRASQPDLCAICSGSRRGRRTHPEEANASATDGHAALGRAEPDAARNPRFFRRFRSEFPPAADALRRELRRWDRWTGHDRPCIRESSCDPAVAMAEGRKSDRRSGLEGSAASTAPFHRRPGNCLLYGDEECRRYLNQRRYGAAKSGSSASSRYLAFSASTSRPRRSNPPTPSIWRSA